MWQARVRRHSQDFRAAVVGQADEGDAAVAVCVGPAGQRGEMNRRLVAKENLHDVACAALAVVFEALVALGDVEIELGDAGDVAAPAGVAARAEGVVDHVADGLDAHAPHGFERLWSEEQGLVGPQKMGLLSFRKREKVTVEARCVGSAGGSEGERVQEIVLRAIRESVQLKDSFSGAAERPKAIQAGAAGGQAGGVENLHGASARCAAR